MIGYADGGAVGRAPGTARTGPAGGREGALALEGAPALLVRPSATVAAASVDPTAATDAAVPSSLDLPFSVPFTHRLRFTRDALGSDERVLLDLLETDPGRTPRVLALVESAVDGPTNVAGRLAALAARHPGRFELLAADVVDGGEAIKNDPGRLLPLLERVNALDLDRRNYVLACGGGAFLDAVGLVAALSHRGVRLIRLPTTTMGQADSGVGVKNAINFFGKKNWLGSFAVPWAVVNDAALLATLPDRDFRCGLSEAVKVALLKEPAFFDRLCADAPRLAARDPDATDFAVRRSAYWHIAHITRGGDPFEMREARPLDFGHWSAHRLEAMTDFAVRHGEAVGIGVAVDCVYSGLVHGLPAGVVRRVIRCFRDLRLPLGHPCLADADGLLRGLEEFRQHLGGRLTVTMLRDVGDPVDVHEVDPAAMRRAIETVNASAGD